VFLSSDYLLVCLSVTDGYAALYELADKRKDPLSTQ